jgi:hypothetical protein
LNENQKAFYLVMTIPLITFNACKEVESTGHLNL